MGTAIRFDRVSKDYRVAKQRPFLAREIVRKLLQRPSQIRRHQVLRDVSFEIEAGESVALVGSNGSGKSTTLGLMARTSYPSAGRVEVLGRVGPLLELGAGFHVDLTGRENIRLNAALLGLTPGEVDARMESIIEFAELGEFIDAPIQTYSTGMWARLGFAVIAHIDPDVLLVDEVLAVGDARFQERCRRTIEGFLAAGKTFLLVSHDLEVVGELCNRVLWLDGGKVRMDGEAREVCLAYWNWSQGIQASSAST